MISLQTCGVRAICYYAGQQELKMETVCYSYHFKVYRFNFFF